MQDNCISNELTFVTASSVLSANTFWTSLIKHMWDSLVFKDWKERNKNSELTMNHSGDSSNYYVH